MNRESISTAKTESVQTRTLPLTIPAPTFQVAVSRVRWKPMSNSDKGLVMGLRYLWAEHLASWQWQYYIMLDTDSPSYEWIEFDWGWQDDLEFLESLPAFESCTGC